MQLPVEHAMEYVNAPSVRSPWMHDIYTYMNGKKALIIDIHLHICIYKYT